MFAVRLSTRLSSWVCLISPFICPASGHQYPLWSTTGPSDVHVPCRHSGNPRCGRNSPVASHTT
eukprot:scaffold289251_cov22-Prasinocladus_malaysianus.AAC.1